MDGQCYGTMRVYQFNPSVSGYLTATGVTSLDNNPQTEGAYELWAWPQLVNEESFLFFHQDNGGGTGEYASLKILKSTGKLEFSSPFVSSAT